MASDEGSTPMTRAAAALAMAAPSWPVVRALATPGLWRVSPRAGVGLAGALCAGFLAIVSITLLAPLPIVLAVALGALAVAAFEAWLARSGRGTGKGLPPGSLGVLPPRPVAKRVVLRGPGCAPR
jgi:hypothetical protein